MIQPVSNNPLPQRFLIDQGSHQETVPSGELKQLQEKGAEVATKILSRLEAPNNTINRLQEKVINDKKEKVSRILHNFVDFNS